MRYYAHAVQVFSMCLCFGFGALFGRSDLVAWAGAFGLWVVFCIWGYGQSLDAIEAQLGRKLEREVRQWTRFPLPASISCPVCTYTVELSGAWCLLTNGHHSEQWLATCAHCSAALILHVRGKNLRPTVAGNG